MKAKFLAGLDLDTLAIKTTKRALLAWELSGVIHPTRCTPSCPTGAVRQFHGPALPKSGANSAEIALLPNSLSVTTWHFSVSATRQNSDQTVKPPTSIAFATRSAQGLNWTQLDGVVGREFGGRRVRASGHAAR